MNGCLDGIHGIELAGLGPGPFCAAMLIDHGAQIDRVVRPKCDALPGIGASGEPMIGGRREVEIDLKDAAGAEQLLRLVDAADFLLEGYRPGVMERLGLGPDVCLARNPRLVYVRITGWGQTGPLAQRAGHDINYIALTGALGSIGPRSTPVAPLNLLGDYAGGGMLAAFGILAALIERNRSGEGQVIDAAMIDGASYLMAPFFELHRSGDWSAERADNLLDGGAPFYGTYPTADGRHLAVGALEPQFFAEFRRGVGLETHPALSAQYDRSTWPSMRTAIAQRVLQHPLQHWEDLFGGTDACVAPVLGLDDVPHHAHHRARSSHMADLLPAAAPRFSRTPGSRRSVTHPPASDAPEGQ